MQLAEPVGITGSACDDEDANDAAMRAELDKLFDSCSEDDDAKAGSIAASAVTSSDRKTG